MVVGPIRPLDEVTMLEKEDSLESVPCVDVLAIEIEEETAVLTELTVGERTVLDISADLVEEVERSTLDRSLDIVKRVIAVVGSGKLVERESEVIISTEVVKKEVILVKNENVSIVVESVPELALDDTDSVEPEDSEILEVLEPMEAVGEVMTLVVRDAPPCELVVAADVRGLSIDEIEVAVVTTDEVVVPDSSRELELIEGPEDVTAPEEDVTPAHVPVVVEDVMGPSVFDQDVAVLVEDLLVQSPQPVGCGIGLSLMDC